MSRPQPNDTNERVCIGPQSFPQGHPSSFPCANLQESATRHTMIDSNIMCIPKWGCTFVCLWIQLSHGQFPFQFPPE